MQGYINWLDSLPYKQEVMGSSPLPCTIKYLFEGTVEEERGRYAFAMAF